MPKVTSLELISEARLKGHAVGAFNVYNLESVQAVAQGVKEANSGVIFQITKSAVDYAGLKNIYDIVMNNIDIYNIPAAIHLDHGPSLEMVDECLEIGFSSVMFDGSSLPFKENIEKSRASVEKAHAHKATCEAELGRLVGTEDEISVDEKNAIYTNPDEALEFVESTGIDLLAVAIGNAHGFYKGEPHIDFERLGEIRKKVDVHLVLHGASGIPDESIQKAIKSGIGKINIDTEFRYATMRGIEDYLSEDAGTSAARNALAAGRERMKQKVIEKINLFRPSN
ncbi:class II fructose-bisphosphate aldolase [bacterium]|nr:class II fructose-bisphosphate aldolase [bacterium]MBU1025217.1 class II fructose-bisphosphate aldolase [bacterium]